MSFVAPSERLFLPEALDSVALGQERIELGDATANHLIKVLRVREGDSFWLGDGRGTLRKVQVESLSKRSLVFECFDEVKRVEKPVPAVTLVLAMLQNRDDLERALTSAVEAGVDRILLFRAERSNRALPDLSGAQGHRLRKLLREASSQSRRPWIPELAIVDEFQGALRCLDALYLADPEASQELEYAISADAQEMGVLIGPEGGFTAAELSVIDGENPKKLWLGPAVLRARTATALAVHRLVLIRETTKS